MERNRFSQNFYKLTNTGRELERTEVSIKYKCLICGYTHDYDDTWSEEKKTEVKVNVDTHHNDHIIQYE